MLTALGRLTLVIGMLLSIAALFTFVSWNARNLQPNIKSYIESQQSPALYKVTYIYK